MAVSLGRNISSLGAQRKLAEGSNQFARVYERLSSGSRINRASDDAAGLAIASSLQSTSRIFGQAVKNANDGISLLSIAEGAMRELSGIVIRITELAEQAANGTYGTSQRQALDTEAQALKDEFERILATTKFNNQALLQDSSYTAHIQVGETGNTDSQISIRLDAPVTTVVGDGTLQSSASAAPGGTQTDSLTSGDINNDGNLDLLWSSASGNVGVMLGNGNGTFKAASTFVPTYGASDKKIHLSDVNGDGNLDYLGVNFNNAYMSVALGAGNGTFGAAVSYRVSAGGATSEGIQLADINNDTILDVIVNDPGTDKMNVSLGVGNGTFQAAVSFDSLVGSSRAVVGDINGDNNIDVMISGSNRIFLGNGNNTFSVSSFTTAIIDRSLALADINGDGFLDYVGGNGVTNIGVLLGNGNGTFKVESVYNASDQGFGRDQISLADFNGDGALDIAVNTIASSVFSILLNNGNGTFKAQTTYATTAGGQAITTADFNEDGVADVATGAYGSARINVYTTNTTSQGGLPSFSLLTRQGALDALDDLDESLDDLNSSLGIIGAAQRRLEYAAHNSSTTRDNSSEAASRITDADIAAEAALAVRLTILQKAGAAVLAQANLQPQLVLNLLKQGTN